MENTKKVQPQHGQDSSKNISTTDIIPHTINNIQLKNDESNIMMRSALVYAERLGWAVFPVHSMHNGRCSCFKSKCGSPGKHPRTINGLKEATKDRAIIIEWWTKWPNANIAVATGEISSFFALDIDLKTDGPASLEDMVSGYGELPHTVEAVTGSGGSHYLFKHEQGIRNLGGMESGIDVRGDGGYIVVTPSNHESGGTYQWELSARPIETEVAAAPDWLIAKIKKANTSSSKHGKKHERKPDSYWIELLQGVGDGERNTSTASLVGYFLKKGISAEISLELTLLWNERCDPPEDEETVIRTFRSILEKEVRRRGGGRS